MARLTLVTIAAPRGGSIARGQQTAALACPPDGYAPPLYGSFGQNGGGGQTAYEIASPCNPQEVRAAAQAVGMGRTQPLGVKNVITIMLSAEGTLAGAGAGMDKLSKADFQISY